MRLCDTVSEVDDLRGKPTGVLLAVDLQQPADHLLQLLDVLFSVALNAEGTREVHPFCIDAPHNLNDNQSESEINFFN